MGGSGRDGKERDLGSLDTDRLLWVSLCPPPIYGYLFRRVMGGEMLHTSQRARTPNLAKRKEGGRVAGPPAAIAPTKLSE